jgi:hypothetical protein
MPLGETRTKAAAGAEINGDMDEEEIDSDDGVGVIDGEKEMGRLPRGKFIATING